MGTRTTSANTRETAAEDGAVVIVIFAVIGS